MNGYFEICNSIKKISVKNGQRLSIFVDEQSLDEESIRLHGISAKKTLLYM